MTRTSGSARQSRTRDVVTFDHNAGVGVLVVTDPLPCRRARPNIVEDYVVRC